VRTELRPLDLGEILDRTFQIYRTHFQLFAGIAAVGAAFMLVWTTIQTFVLRSLSAHGLSATRLQGVNGIVQLVALGVSLISLSLVWGAMVQTVAAIYREEPTGVSLALRGMLPKWFRLACVTLTAFVVAWLPFVAGVVALVVLAARAKVGGGADAGPLIVMGVIGFSFLIFVPLGIWLSLRYLLANAACAYEGTNIRQSLRRSASLGKGVRGRMLVMLLVAGLIQLAVGAILSIPTWVALARNRFHPPLWTVIYTLLSSFVSNTLTEAIPGIGVALFYFDARIRKEGLDIEWSLQPAEPSGIESGPVVVSEPSPGVG
jgi:hypothetical protein